LNQVQLKKEEQTGKDKEKKVAQLEKQYQLLCQTSGATKLSKTACYKNQVFGKNIQHPVLTHFYSCKPHYSFQLSV
jgi:hypothetical protein